MIFRMLLIALFMLTTAVSASAEIYKYRDADGVLRFTNNLQEVPKDQREGVQSYHEIENKAEPAESPAQENAVEPQADDALRQEEQTLKDEKALLDAEFAKLEEERKLLVELSQKDRSDEEDAEFRQHIESFNARIKDYDEKLKVFEEKVSKYNAKVK